MAYLARFLLNFDAGSAEWWAENGKGLPLDLDRDALRTLRQREFGQFSESVEVGLQQFGGANGPRQLFLLLLSRYGSTPLGKLQIALLFSLLGDYAQPSDLIRGALGDADNATIVSLELGPVRGRGYYNEQPVVTISAPDGAGTPARARAALEGTGRLSGLRLRSSGSGYVSEPVVSITPPAARSGQAAEAVAEVVGGRVVGLRLVFAGSGYRQDDVVTVTIDSARDSFDIPQGVQAEAEVLLERRVASIELLEPGSGYRVDQPLEVTVTAPQVPRTSRREGVELYKGEAAMVTPVVERLNELSAAPPYLYLQPPGSISEELLRLLPATLRPTELLSTGRRAARTPTPPTRALRPAGPCCVGQPAAITRRGGPSPHSLLLFGQLQARPRRRRAPRGRRGRRQGRPRRPRRPRGRGARRCRAERAAAPLRGAGRGAARAGHLRRGRLGARAARGRARRA